MNDVHGEAEDYMRSQRGRGTSTTLSRLEEPTTEEAEECAWARMWPTA